jgi:2-polyprenyl-3-methyl-5-hydroxy-6-metoxy-1,4-benzoquinol methylase
LLHRPGANLGVDRCGTCGFVYLDGWEQSLARHAELYDYYSDLDEATMAERHSPQNRARQQELLRELARLTHGRTLLDVGCGDGQLLETARDEGWDGTGIDLSEPAIRICRERGLAASKTDFFDHAFDARRFDAIVMSELVEHVPSPHRFLRRASDLLKPGGVLYLTTPNFGSLARRMLGDSWSVIHPEHIGYFERATLKQMASEHTGLRVLKIEANNISPSTIVAWMRSRGREAATEATHAHREAREGLDQRLRGAILKSRTLSAAKKMANHLISRSGLGDTLVAWLQKPTSSG